MKSIKNQNQNKIENEIDKREDTPSKKGRIFICMAVDFNIALLINDIHDIWMFID